MKYRNIAFLFPGQGAQQVGMGKDFFDSFAEARETFEEGDSLLQSSITKMIFTGPEEVLKETKNSQTAIYLSSMAMLNVLKKQFPALLPKVTAGLSLGEYTALTAAGKISFASCLPLVHYRGACMHEACEATKGAMAAVFGLSAEEIKNVVQELNLPRDLWVANFNSSEQTVISGTLLGVEKGMEAAKARGAKRVIPLKVHGAFHSGLMQNAQEKLKSRIEEAPLQESQVRVVMNVTGGYVDKSQDMRTLLVEQVTKPVYWEKTILTMKGDVECFIEIGPGRTLAGLNKQMGIEAPTISINKVEDLELLSKII